MKRTVLLPFALLISGWAVLDSGLSDRGVVKADGEGACAVTTIIPGSNGFYPVPSGCDRVKVRLWGQGGASWVTGEGGVPNAGIGGGGGYTFGIVNLSSGFTTIGVSLPPFQQFGGGNGGGRTTVFQGAGSTPLAIAAGGGGAGHGGNGGPPGNGGPGGGGFGLSGQSIGSGGYIAGGGGGASQSGVGAGGTNQPVYLPCYGLSGGGGGCIGKQVGGGGGGGYFRGGGGAATGMIGSRNDPYSGAGGGGGSGYVDSADWGMSTILVSGVGGQPGNMQDPYYAAGVGVGGVPSPNILVTRGGPGRVVLTFGEDITVDDSRYPPGLGPGSFCPELDPPPAPLVQSFPYPGDPPAGCIGNLLLCREDFFEAGAICQYVCHPVSDPVPYLFKAC